MRRHHYGTARIFGGQDRFLVADVYHENDRELIALAPDMARLLIDMADDLRDMGFTRYGDEPADELLARFADLDARAGGTT